MGRIANLWIAVIEGPMSIYYHCLEDLDETRWARKTLLKKNN